MGKVFYADLWGLRKEKYRYLLENDVSTTQWQELQPVQPYFFFVPKEFDLLSEYEQGWNVTRVFPVHSRGIETGRDEHLIAFEVSDIMEVARAIADDSVTDVELEERYGIRDTSGWPAGKRREMILAEGFDRTQIVSVNYRPFDWRYTYFSDFLRRTHKKVMRHLLRDNIALIAIRQVVGPKKFSHVGVTTCIADNRVFFSNRSGPVIFPLYLYTTRKENPRKISGGIIALTLFEPKAEYETREPNLSPEFITAVEEKLGLKFVPEGKGDLATTFGPEGILHYAYAVFHSPTYRERYAEFLKIDFPRLPLASDRKLFKALAEKGKELVSLHLMESAKLSQLITSFPVPGSNEVERVHYTEPRGDVPGRVYINKTQYFEGIEPEVWEFQIGGYQVLNKWLKDRKGRKLTFDDLFHWQKIVVALKETMRLMEEIDELIPKWPIE